MEDDVYDEVEIENMEFNQEMMAFKYACPCGDKFIIYLVHS